MPAPIVAVVSLETGKHAQLSAYPANAQGIFELPTTFTWTTASPSVATVDQTGLVTGVAPGTTTITATGANGLSSAATVVVAANPMTQLLIAVGNRD